jgi:peptidoglycan L-alanyl-D-glutamate endopeptidase CwlK
MNSRHITGHAIDFAVLIGGKVRWDWPLYGQVAEAFKRASKELNVPIIWGGDWKSLRDGPHVELRRREYP